MIKRRKMRLNGELQLVNRNRVYELTYNIRKIPYMCDAVILFRLRTMHIIELASMLRETYFSP